ncbi:MAG: lytic transglycosylase domain-containing protein [Magnetococcales bacterium]|nr:lytic transglycosylase domain-containing protein [Magnetococcales bacterium]
MFCLIFSFLSAINGREPCKNQYIGRAFRLTCCPRKKARSPLLPVVSKHGRRDPVGLLSTAVAGCLAVWLGGTQPARADIFAFVDQKGVIHLTDRADDPRYRLLIRFPKKKDGVRVMSPEHDVTANPRYGTVIRAAATRYDLDEALVHAVIRAESGYDSDAISPKGAVGLMQLMPETASRYGVRNRRDPESNIDGGSRYLRDLLQMFNNNLHLSLAAYNAGENAVKRYGNQIPPYEETRQYVTRVLQFYKIYRDKL